MCYLTFFLWRQGNPNLSSDRAVLSTIPPQRDRTTLNGATGLCVHW